MPPTAASIGQLTLWLQKYYEVLNPENAQNAPKIAAALFHDQESLDTKLKVKHDGKGLRFAARQAGDLPEKRKEPSRTEEQPAKKVTPRIIMCCPSSSSASYPTT